MMLDDISLLSLELEYTSERPGEDGPLLDMKLGGPLHPKPKCKQFNSICLFRWLYHIDKLTIAWRLKL